MTAGTATLAVMLTIAPALYDKIIAHARADHPDEACGVVAGPAGSDRPDRFVPMLNAERSPTFYRFDSMEQLRVWREMDDRDEEPVVIYHSHTATEAYPSRTDISYASEPGAHYVLVSTRDPDEAEFRSYRIVDGLVTEEEVRIAARAEEEVRIAARAEEEVRIAARAEEEVRIAARTGEEARIAREDTGAGGGPGQDAALAPE